MSRARASSFGSSRTWTSKDTGGYKVEDAEALGFRVLLCCKVKSFGVFGLGCFARGWLGSPACSCSGSHRGRQMWMVEVQSYVRVFEGLGLNPKP